MNLGSLFPAGTRTLRLISAFAFATTVFAQTPVISGVLNTASFDSRLSPGAAVVIFGSNLGANTSTPVTVGGKAAAVLFASPTQFNVQIPFDAALGQSSVAVGTSQPFNITITQYAPALYTADQSGKGLASAAHTQPPGPVTANNPVAGGEVISLYATGLGATMPPLATGMPGPANPPAATATTPTVTVDGQDAAVLAAVMQPNGVGVYQINLRLPAVLADGNHTVVLTIGGLMSNAVTLPVGMPVAQPPPVIGGVVSATGIPGSVQSNIQAGCWVAIYGTNLSDLTTDWTNDIANGKLPVALAGVSVTVNGQAAYVYFVSPGQINVQAPTVNLGDVQVVVTNNGRVSAPGKAHVETHAPAFFQWGANKYALTTRYPDNTYIANPSLGQIYVGPKPGNVLILWGTGFGPTVPPAAPGQITSGAPVTETLPTVTVGGMPATVIGAALSPGLVGVYQVAIQLPDNVPTGDVLVRATIAGFQTPDNVYLYIAP